MAIQIIERSQSLANRLAELIREEGINLPLHYSGTYTDAVKIAQEIKAKYTLLDMNFPGDSSCTLLKLIKKTNPECVVIVLYSCEDRLKLDQCLQLGADFIFNKYDGFEEIPAIIKIGEG